MAVRGRLGMGAAHYLRGNDAPLSCLGKLVDGRTRAIGLLAAALMFIAACASLALPTTTAAASTAPRIAPAGQVASAAISGSNAYLNGDSCTSGVFCMAVGTYSLGGHTPAFSEMLSSGSWVAEPVASPSRGPSVFANEVSCASPASCLFVGDHWSGKHGLVVNIAEAWNGSSWRIVTAAGPAGTRYSYLDDVACPTTKFCLAIGAAGTSRNGYHSTAYTWENGTSWKRITVPGPNRARNSELGGLACFNSKNCMAVGDYTSASGRYLPFAARWHDGKWKLMTTPAVPGQRFTVFQGISCPTATQCVAVGNTEKGTRYQYLYAFAEAWDGGKWHVSRLRRSYSVFIGVSCPARHRCFASGYTFPGRSRFAIPLIETWNGRTWTTQHAAQASAPHSGDSLQHVSCVTRYDCEAVGYSYNGNASNSDLALAEKWNGHHWTLQTTPNP